MPEKPFPNPGRQLVFFLLGALGKTGVSGSEAPTKEIKKIAHGAALGKALSIPARNAEAVVYRQAENKKGAQALKRQNRGAWRAFFFSFIAALCLFILGIGFLTVDYQGRNMSFGDDTPVFQIIKRYDGAADLKIKAMGREATMDFTALDKLWNFLLDFSCLPHN